MIVELPGGAATSSLGFGCSALIGGRTRTEARRLLDVAYDAGIRHFDVARVYGTGDAESVLGDFAARRRDEISIATKFGLDPLPPTASVTVLKRVIRPALRRSRRLLGIARRHASRAVARSAEFTPEGARRSLQTSLRELRTPYVDLLLLHDCTAEQWAQESLQATLAQLRDEGLIRAFGPASSYAEVSAIGAPQPVVAQFESDVLNGHAQDFSAAALPITYGALRAALPLIRRHLADPSTAAAWTRALGISAAEHLPEFLLSAALQENADGIVLFSAGSEDRIRRNALIADEPPYTREQVSELIVRAQGLR